MFPAEVFAARWGAGGLANPVRGARSSHAQYIFQSTCFVGQAASIVQATVWCTEGFFIIENLTTEAIGTQ